jgi:hypothetical protein
MNTFNNWQKNSRLPFVKAPLLCLFGAVLSAVVACPVLAEQRSAIDLTHFESKITVSCDARPVAGSTRAPPQELLEWCVKACEIHGYSQKNGYELAEVSDYTLPPRLDRSLWPWARKMTPSQCLPFRPVTTKRVSNEKCLEYRQRVTVKGMLAIYGGSGLIIKDVRPYCIRADSRNPLWMPEADNLNGLSLVIPEANQRPFKDRIGEQVVLSGMLEYRVHEDTAARNLVDVELLETKREPD